MKHRNDNITVPPVRDVTRFRNTEGFMVLERTYKQDSMRTIVPTFEWVTIPIAYVFPDNRPHYVGKHRKGDPIPHTLIPSARILSYGGHWNSWQWEDPIPHTLIPSARILSYGGHWNSWQWDKDKYAL